MTGREITEKRLQGHGGRQVVGSGMREGDRRRRDRDGTDACEIVEERNLRKRWE